MELVLSFGMEGGDGEYLYCEPLDDGFRFLRKFSHLQFNFDDWKSGEESLHSFEEFWNRIIKDPKWYKFHPRFVHQKFREPVLKALQQINLETLQEDEMRFIDAWVWVLAKGKYNTDNHFKNQCRWHQSTYRSEELKVSFDEDVNVLLNEDGLKGLNFYDGLGIREWGKNKPFRKLLHCNLLRSEHIPINFFIPFDQDKEFCKMVFNDLLGSIIDKMGDVVIEHAPQPKGKYLDDRTSFDTYIEYRHTDGSMGILGIEVKYTEGSYLLKEGTTEHRRMTKDFDKSKYKEITEKTRKFELNNGDFDQLKQDRYRQIWRNHLLGESILLEKDSKYRHFHSLTFYPCGNTHFTEIIRKYREKFLKPEFQDCVRGVTYEDFFRSCKKFAVKKHYLNWLEYLEKRYLL